MTTYGELGTYFYIQYGSLCTCTVQLHFVHCTDIEHYVTVQQRFRHRPCLADLAVFAVRGGGK